MCVSISELCSAPALVGQTKLWIEIAIPEWLRLADLGQLLPAAMGRNPPEMAVSRMDGANGRQLKQIR